MPKDKEKSITQLFHEAENRSKKLGFQLQKLQIDYAKAIEETEHLRLQAIEELQRKGEQKLDFQER